MDAAQDVHRCRPPGSGKSTVFPVSGFGVDFFNADDRAAQLNRGSYRGIPRSIRDRVNRQFETFVNDCIGRRASFALETTLRGSVTFDQAATAGREGFFVEMHYRALTNFAQHVERVRIRADRGGHSAPESVLAEGGQVVYIAGQHPEWLEQVLAEL